GRTKAATRGRVAMTTWRCSLASVCRGGWLAPRAAAHCRLWRDDYAGVPGTEQGEIRIRREIGAHRPRGRSARAGREKLSAGRKRGRPALDGRGRLSARRGRRRRLVGADVAAPRLARLAALVRRR